MADFDAVRDATVVGVRVGRVGVRDLDLGAVVQPVAVGVGVVGVGAGLLLLYGVEPVTVGVTDRREVVGGVVRVAASTDLDAVGDAAVVGVGLGRVGVVDAYLGAVLQPVAIGVGVVRVGAGLLLDRKSTRLNSSH